MNERISLFLYSGTKHGWLEYESKFLNKCKDNISLKWYNMYYKKKNGFFTNLSRLKKLNMNSIVWNI